MYLYGSTEQTLDLLVRKLHERFPALKIAGMEASKFRAGAAGRARGDRRADQGVRARAW